MTRDDVLLLLGDMPDGRLPLAVHAGEYRDMGTFGLQQVSYDVEAGERVSAYILIPHSIDIHGTKKHPAVVACHQHGGRYETGKSEPIGLCGDPANTFAVTLCSHGYVVICPDHTGFEERREHLSDGTLMDGRDNERWLFIDLLLHGRTLLGKNLSDLSRAIDVLGTLSFVDQDRICICGHSMGGLIALWGGWFDRRIKAIVSSCGFSSLAVLQAAHLNHTFSMYLPSLLKHGDTPEIISHFCPTPLYLTFGRQDRIFPYEESERICSYALALYEKAGAPEACRAEVTDDGHVFTDEKQKKTVDFFKAHL